MNTLIKQYEAEIRSQIYSDLQKGIGVSVLVENDAHCLSFSTSPATLTDYKVDDITVWIGEDEIDENQTLSELELDFISIIEEEHFNIQRNK